MCKVEHPLEYFEKSNQTKDGKSCIRDHYLFIKDKYGKIKCECGEDIVRTYTDKHKETDIHRRKLNGVKNAHFVNKRNHEINLARVKVMEMGMLISVKIVEIHTKAKKK
jgi:hypothetical protein